MYQHHFRAAMASLILVSAFACAPAVLTQSYPRGLDISGELITYGEPEITLVSLSVKRQDKAPSWNAEFEDGTRAEIIAEDIPGLTILKWKVDKERMTTLTKVPYKLRVANGSATFDTTVSFSSAGRDFSGQTLLKVVTQLVISH
ncbi:hypothetical protein [Geothrix fuzhouensis]|uniref:hypothetical protein n=1 Tax=Geothrix fuzhouensis TaxID=2966451 RepID=UPI00214720F6|nr:hypothetical protein [Geothrix fuzhouensis]